MDRDRVGSGPSRHPLQRRPAAAVADKFRRALDIRTLSQREVDHYLAELRERARRKREEDSGEQS